MNRRIARGNMRVVYAVEIPAGQSRREILNSAITTPVHALLLAVALEAGLFRPAPESLPLIALTFVGTFIWTEIWHYVSHVAMHWRPLHFIHREHHRSRVTQPWTSVSFSLLEKFIFSAGIIGFMSIVSQHLEVSFYGVALYYVFYFFTNTLGHSNIEIRSENYSETVMGKIFNTPAYHAMHHARYIKNYGLITPVLDRIFGTAWPDAPKVQRRAAVCDPLKHINEKLIRPSTSDSTIV